jgi:membrane-bound serine protease (ClpP class)
MSCSSSIGARRRRACWLAVPLLLAISAFAWAAAAGSTTALLTVDGPIGPATAAYVENGLERAKAAGAGLVVLELDTPGGLDSAMRQIIKGILASPVPVASYVTPSGARAASAGTYILYASHIAAMAPGTNLGAATPVQIGGFGGGGGGGDEAEPKHATMEDKITNDAVAYIRSLAQLRGRNADWAEKAVREAASLPAEAALEAKVIDLIAPTLPDLLHQLDGRTVRTVAGEVTLHPEAARIQRLEPDWRNRLLGFITDPTVAYILMLVGIYGIIFELFSPGLVGPGLVGAISLLLALYAFQILPVSWTGVALIGLGVALMTAEAFLPTFGVIGVAGIVAFVTGSVLLMDTGVPGFSVSLLAIGAFAAVAGGLVLLTVSLAVRSQRRPIASGAEELLRERGSVIAWDGREGRIRIQGEIWYARGPTGLAPGERVTVRSREGLVLEVERDPQAG